MRAVTVEPHRIRSAWEGRISGCMLGKPLEILSFQQGPSGLDAYLTQSAALPLRDYVPLIEGTIVDRVGRACCRGQMVRAEPDDDINYTLLALGLTGVAIPDAWTRPWAGRIGVGLAGYDELSIDNVVQRTVAVAQSIGEHLE